MAPERQTLTRSAVLSSVRATRSFTRRAKGTGPTAVSPTPRKSPVKKTAKAKRKRPRQTEEGDEDVSEAPVPKKSPVKKKKGRNAKKAKSTPKTEEKSTEEAESATENSGDVDEDASEAPVPEMSPVKKGKKAKSTPEVEEQSDEEAGGESKKIVIEHCTQCNSFKTRANQAKNGLESGVSGITVLLNPDKPRKGCFEIREESGETFISLLGMKRPFTKMKELNMGTVIEEIIAKIK